jgi:hypothetical protein
VELVSELAVPDKITPERGYRAWRLRRDVESGELRLVSMRSPTVVWRPREPMRADCLGFNATGSVMFQVGWSSSEEEGKSERNHLPSCHSAPFERCHCGIYALLELGAMRQFIAPKIILGEVELWGKVIPGTTGWRAEYARPVRFFTLPEDVYREPFRPYPTAALIEEAAYVYQAEVEELPPEVTARWLRPQQEGGMLTRTAQFIASSRMLRSSPSGTGQFIGSSFVPFPPMQTLTWSEERLPFWERACDWLFLKHPFLGWLALMLIFWGVAVGSIALSHLV